MAYRLCREARPDSIRDDLMDYFFSKHPRKYRIIGPRNVVPRQPDRTSAILEELDAFERSSRDHANDIEIAGCRA